MPNWTQSGSRASSRWTKLRSRPDAIAALYKVEQAIRNDGLTGPAKHAGRQEQFKPILDGFFVWIDEQFDKQGFLPSSHFLGALADSRERRIGLFVYLDDPDVSIDTNHLERALRVIPTGKKNWLTRLRLSRCTRPFSSSENSSDQSRTQRGDGGN